MAAIPGLMEFQERDTAFREDAFLARLRAGFQGFYRAWAAQDLTPVRGFISDGVMESCLVQLDLMEYRELSPSSLENVAVKEESCLACDSDDHFDIVHVRFRAGWGTGGGQNESGQTWSLVRRRGVPSAGRPGVIEGKCPACGAPLKAQDSAACAGCRAVMNSGEHDWVLSSVSWSADLKHFGGGRIVPGVDAIRGKDPHFNPLFIEDRAHVAFWRWQLAHWEEDAASLRSVATDGVVARFLTQRRQGAVWYEDPVLQYVRTLDCRPGGDFDRIYEEVVWTANKFEFSKSERVPLGRRSNCDIFVFARRAGVATDPRVGLHSLLCPACGALPEGRTSPACAKCGAPFHDGSRSWVLTDTRPYTPNWYLPTPQPGR